jgi:hypothetical protein
MPSPYEAWANPRGVALKQHLSAILKDRAPKHADIAERLSHAIQTDRDLEAFGALVVDLYEIGYFQALDQYRDLLKQLGYNVTIGAQESESPVKGNTIFQKKD